MYLFWDVLGRDGEGIFWYAAEASDKTASNLIPQILSDAFRTFTKRAFLGLVWTGSGGGNNGMGEMTDPVTPVFWKELILKKTTWTLNNLESKSQLERNFGLWTMYLRICTESFTDKQFIAIHRSVLDT